MESLANKWVARCLFEHPDSTFYPEYSNFGQNLAAFGGYKPTDIYERSVFGWNQEKVNYTYSTNRCNAVCGHYTQVRKRLNV
ncbi:unnamed protein product [Schistocephalus solidus]|uniref:SCP domain-containing protein n=1 Tax=Schistocephalus solidus TaxID=70667 RepID=A0A183TGU9_SCHSO|nr:unnamed protein product [Schistocephalus solidus]